MLLNLYLQITSHTIVLVTIASLFLTLAFAIPRKFSGFKIFALLFLFFSIFNITLGHRLTNLMIYNHGEPGMAMITSTETTNNMHNRQYVERYYTLLEKTDGTTVETYFEDWDFNIYPPPEGGRYRYPAKGVKFPVKYMESDPSLFIILEEEPSAYSKGLDCKSLKATLDETRLKMTFDTDNEEYKSQYQEAVKEYTEKECLPLLPEVFFQDYLEENKEEFDAMDPKMQALFKELAEDWVQ